MKTGEGLHSGVMWQTLRQLLIWVRRPPLSFTLRWPCKAKTYPVRVLSKSLKEWVSLTAGRCSTRYLHSKQSVELTVR